jgi:hypothetical protein
MIKTPTIIPSCKAVGEDVRVCVTAPAVHPSGPPGQAQEGLLPSQSVSPVMDAPGPGTPLQAEGLPLWVVTILVALAVLAFARVYAKIRPGRHENSVRLTTPSSCKSTDSLTEGTSDRDRRFEELVQGLIGTYDLSGSELVRAHVQKSLRGVGIVAISPEPGERFDMALHNGVAAIPAPDPDLDFRIARVLRPGWRSAGEILRPADVEVYKD